MRERLSAALVGLEPGLRGRVTLAGNQEEMSPVHEACDMVLLSSRTEGMPVALIEAAAASLPVISTPVGGVPELVQDGLTGRLADGVEGLSAALCELAADDELRLKMGRTAREVVRGRHSATALAENLERVYAEVAGEVACAS